MEIYHTIRKYCAVSGIQSSQLNHRFLNFVEKFLLFFLFVFAIVSSCAFLAYDAQNITEFTNGFYTLITFALVCFIFVVHVWKYDRFFKFMKNFENIIFDSE